MASAVLLLHGFTGTAQTMAPIAEALAAHGFPIISPTLPGHGTSVQDLACATADDWYRAALRALDEAQGFPPRPVLVAGISLGALLALKLAALAPARVMAVALLSTPVHLPLAARPLVPLFRNTPLGRIWRFVRKSSEMGIADPVGRAAHIAYRVMPSEGIVQISALAAEVRGLLPKVRCPALIVHARRDPTASFRHVPFLIERLGSAEKELVVLECSRHIITFDYEKGRVIDAVTSFFERVA